MYKLITLFLLAMSTNCYSNYCDSWSCLHANDIWGYDYTSDYYQYGLNGDFAYSFFADDALAWNLNIDHFHSDIELFEDHHNDYWNHFNENLKDYSRFNYEYADFHTDAFRTYDNYYTSYSGVNRLGRFLGKYSDDRYRSQILFPSGCGNRCMDNYRSIYSAWHSSIYDLRRNHYYDIRDLSCSNRRVSMRGWFQDAVYKYESNLSRRLTDYYDYIYGDYVCDAHWF